MKEIIEKVFINDIPNLDKIIDNWERYNPGFTPKFGKLSDLIITKGFWVEDMETQKFLNYLAEETQKQKNYHRKTIPLIADREPLITRNYDKLMQTNAFKKVIDVLMELNPTLIEEYHLNRNDFEQAYIKTLDSYAKQEALTYWSLLKYNDNYELTNCFLSDTEDREMFYQFLKKKQKC